MQQNQSGQVISVNVGQPRTVKWKGRLVSTGIFKEPVEGRIKVKQRPAPSRRLLGGVHERYLRGFR